MLKRREASPPGLYLALSPREKKLSFTTEALATLPLQLCGKAFIESGAVKSTIYEILVLSL